MARAGAIAPGKASGYFARRTAIELVVLDGLTLGAVLLVIASRIHDPLAGGLLLGLVAAPGLILTARSLVWALGSRQGLSLEGLRPDHVPADDHATETARRFARAGLILLALPLAPVGMVVATAAALP